MANSRFNRRKRRKTRKWVKWTIALLISIIVIALCFGGYLAYQTLSAAKESHVSLHRKGNKSKLRKKAPKITKDPIAILMEGIENYSTGYKNGRADSLIVAVLNPKSHKVTMVSLNRDWRVMLPPKALPQSISPYRHYKINAAHAYGSMSGYGGNKLEMETVQKLLGIPIDDFVSVDFKGFTDIVDALGGVNIDVKYPFYQKNFFTGKRIYFNQGPQHMNGQQALAFSRMRERAIDVKYTRMHRQKQFLKAAMKQAISAGTIFQINKISGIIGKHVKTNLTPSDIYSLERAYAKMSPSNITTLHINGEDKRIPANTGTYYFVPDQQSLNQIKQKLRKQLELPPSNSTSSTSNGTSSAGTQNNTNGQG